MFDYAYFKKYSFYFLVLFLCLLGGAIFFFVQKDLLIFRLNFGFGNAQDTTFSDAKRETVLRKKVRLYYWKEDKVLFEEQYFVWLSDKSENLKHLVNNWLSFLHQERLLDKKIYVDSVLIDPSGQQAYFSFDQSPFDREWSIFQKCCFIESMFKTISNSEIDIKFVFFLLGHQFLEDDHLDFSQAWPIEGFLRETF